MIDRCTNPKSSSWQNYGARGIHVHQDWLTGRSGMTGLETFAQDMGECPEGHSIERQDNSKGYSPENCVWASKTVQSRNRRSLRYVTYAGETKSVGEWAEETGIPYFTLIRRLDRGWTPERALTTP